MEFVGRSIKQLKKMVLLGEGINNRKMQLLREEDDVIYWESEK